MRMVILIVGLAFVLAHTPKGIMILVEQSIAAEINNESTLYIKTNFGK